MQALVYSIICSVEILIRQEQNLFMNMHLPKKKVLPDETDVNTPYKRLKYI